MLYICNVHLSIYVCNQSKHFTCHVPDYVCVCMCVAALLLAGPRFLEPSVWHAIWWGSPALCLLWVLCCVVLCCVCPPLLSHVLCLIVLPFSCHARMFPHFLSHASPSPTLFLFTCFTLVFFPKPQASIPPTCVSRYSLYLHAIYIFPASFSSHNTFTTNHLHCVDI